MKRRFYIGDPDLKNSTSATPLEMANAAEGTRKIGGGTNASGSTQGDGSELCRVGVKVPPFWPEEPAVWFAQLEMQFDLAGITSDRTKFAYAVSQLETPYVSHIKDIVITPPSENRYEKLKVELVKRLSASQENKTKQLLMHEELGDRKPSNFMRHLRSLAGPSVPDEFIRTIWTSRLPTNLQTIVASQAKVDLDTVADLADRVHDIVQPSPHVASTSASATVSPLETRIAQLEELIRGRKHFQNNNFRGGRYRGRSRSNNGRRSRNNSKERPDNHPHCWYHFTFGARAKKCSQPCTFQSENSKSSH